MHAMFNDQKLHLNCIPGRVMASQGGENIPKKKLILI